MHLEISMALTLLISKCYMYMYVIKCSTLLKKSTEKSKCEKYFKHFINKGKEFQFDK